MKRVVQFLFLSLMILFIGGILIGLGGLFSLFAFEAPVLRKSSVLVLELNDVIDDNNQALKFLKKYRDEDDVKGVLIRISSPGGVVGPSQELYAEIKKTREEYKKPVVAYCSSIAASGAYYAAVAADKIVTTPGCMVGSIGALMSFVNLEGLYDWAKVKRYSITTGKFKDSGAEYKAMTAKERALFQEMLDDVLDQFKGAVAEGRHMKPHQLDPYADGRVFTGRKAVQLGFADQVGTWSDALKLIGELSGLGDKPETYKPVRRPSLRELLEDSGDFEMHWKNGVEKLLRMQHSGMPLYLLPPMGGL